MGGDSPARHKSARLWRIYPLSVSTVRYPPLIAAPSLQLVCFCQGWLASLRADNAGKKVVFAKQVWSLEFRSSLYLPGK